ncbi:MAG: mandelate racemase/muconate lactonizing enzyme family protein [Cyclobacteriaceae bacterium]
MENRRDFVKKIVIGSAASALAAAPLSIASAKSNAKGVNSKITDIEVTLHKKEPNPNPIRDALQSLPGVGQLSVRVITDDGFSGSGSISYGRIAGGLEALEGVIIQELAPVVKGMQLSKIRQIYEAMVYETDYHGTSGIATLAIAAIDTALWDCLGKTLETPCWNIWGGCHDSIPAYGMLGWINYDEKQLKERCEKALSQGYKALKLKVGFPTLKQDIARIKFVKSIIGEDIRLMVDANQVLTVGEAIMRGKAYEDLGLYWLEEPIPAHDLEGYKKIGLELSIQLATGENLFSSHDFSRFIKNDAVDIVQPDLRRAGGPTALLEIGHMAHAFNIPYASHGGGAAHMNVMACLPNVIYVETGGTDFLVDGRLNLPEGPGFDWE